MVARPPTDPRDRLIVPLDVPTRDDALQVVDELEGIVSFYKVNYQLILREGMSFVRELIEQHQKKVFLDIKLDDVEETVIQATKEVARAQVSFLTIHGNGATVTAARTGRNGSETPKILSVTLLSSLDTQDLQDLGIIGKKGKARFQTLEEYVQWRGQEAIKAGCDGLIASGASVSQLRGIVGENPIIVTPGIRPEGTPKEDHKRALTPKEAIMAGADYLVVGRPIRNAPNRREAASRIVDEIEQGSNASVS